MENKIINEKLNLIKKCVESYQIIPDNVAIMLMEQITNILSTIHVCGEEQRKFLDEIEGIETNQKDIPPDIADVLNKRFMDLF